LQVSECARRAVRRDGGYRAATARRGDAFGRGCNSGESLPRLTEAVVHGPDCDVREHRSRIDGLLKLRRFMQRLGKLPARIASYFKHKYIEYAAVPEFTTT
jgi:hypothetical protein